MPEKVWETDDGEYLVIIGQPVPPAIASIIYYDVAPGEVAVWVRKEIVAKHFEGRKNDSGSASGERSAHY